MKSLPRMPGHNEKLQLYHLVGNVQIQTDASEIQREFITCDGETTWL